MAIIGILASMLLLAVAKAPGRVRRLVCTSNLRQQGIAFHTFAHDHRDRFPQSVSMSEGGALEQNSRSPMIGRTFVVNPHAYRVLSNELGSVRILVCPSSRQVRAVDFPRLGFSNLSYFIAVDASPAVPQSVLGGDNNLIPSTNRPVAGMVTGLTPLELQWTPDRHTHGGNVLTSDGAVQFQRGISVQPALRTGISPAPVVRPTGAAVPAPPPSVRVEPTRTAPAPVGVGSSRVGSAPVPEPSSPVSTPVATGPTSPAVSTNPPNRWVPPAAEASNAAPITEPVVLAARPARVTRREWPWWLLLIAVLALVTWYTWRRARAERRGAG